MRQVEIKPVTISNDIPLPDLGIVERRLAEARAAFTRKIVVLDDDPTGIQTVHDVPVYTNWRQQTLEQALLETCGMFFVLTNSGSSQPKRPSGHTGRSRKIWPLRPG